MSIRGQVGSLPPAPYKDGAGQAIETGVVPYLNRMILEGAAARRTLRSSAPTVAACSGVAIIVVMAINAAPEDAVVAGLRSVANDDAR